ncbi:AI-2E family transporter [Agromyces mediolanus]|uniref:AI-2E family transporter n=1 Tax=Agromyces mediolanus TaxID=41986 RepID=A0A918CH10_AGRME|nr:AI-2E family transporter [Agromyces mediolanus]GGR21441.1 AI-2E family transporter [Agromyces mediolanus]GLJ73808.1 AI-2E family transporter [Agromyces mediolanus]
MEDSKGRARGRFLRRSRAADAEATKHEAPDERDAREGVPYGMRLAAAWSWRLLLVGGVVAVVIFLVIQLRLIVIPLLVAVLLSALLVPFSQFLQRHRWPKWLSVTTAMLAMLAVVGGLLTLGIWQIARGSDELAAQSLTAWEDLKVWLLEGPFHITEAQLNDWVGQAVTAIQQDSGVLWSGALSVGSSFGHFLAGMLLALFATLFILIDGRGIWRWLVGIFPRRGRAAIDGAGRAGWTTLQNFVKVQILVATIDAVGIGLGALLLGVPLAIPIAVLVFLGSFIPIVGAVATGALAVFVALVYNGWVIALIMLGVVLLVQQVEGHVLQPLIMGTAVKVHPLGVVIAVATGSLLAGIPGALFAVPIAAVANVMIAYIAKGDWKRGSPPADSDATSPLWRTVPQRPGFQRGEPTP